MILETEKRSLDILLADDGSDHALAAIELIRELPLSSSSSVTAIGVLIPRDSSSHARLAAVLEHTHNMLREKNIQVQTELILGYPEEILIDYAAKTNPDLIVLGAKGLRATLGILLGGVAQQIVEYSSSPVLVVRAPYRGIKRIATLIDGSIHGKRALGYLSGEGFSGTDQCQPFPFPPDPQITVIHVLPPLPSPELIARSWPLGPDMLPSYTPDPDAEETWLKKEEPRGQAILDEAIDLLAACGISATGKLLWGDAATEIIEYVKENDIDLIVAGSRGLSQMRGWLLGSVSRKLVHYAGCSVLIVKGESEAD